MALAGAAMTMQEEREMLLDFCAYANMRQPEGGDTPAFRLRVVDGFLATRRPGFAGFTDDELKGVARDSAGAPASAREVVEQIVVTLDPHHTNRELREWAEAFADAAERAVPREADAELGGSL